MAIADTAGLPALAFQLGSLVAAPGGTVYDAALYPLPPWTPAGGFAIDRAFLFAIMRQESKFEPHARSAAGATGLMQLMPATARGVTDETGLGDEAGARLAEPQLNLTLGQRYVGSLRELPEVGDSLLPMMAAYNAGPDNLAKWRRTLPRDSDPLMFIEGLASRETRDFIERVLAGLWIYRARLDQRDPSLDAVAAGHWPIYMPVEAPPEQVAEHGEDR